MRASLGAISVSTAAVFLASVLFLSCASPGPAQAPRPGSVNPRPGPGKSYFVEAFRIGWYDSVRNPANPRRLAEAGFDVVMPYAGSFSLDQVREYLSAAEKAGIGVHMDVPRYTYRGAEGNALETFIRTVRDNPSIISWYLADEPEWRPGHSPGLLERAYSRVRALDAERDIVQVFMFPFRAGAYRGSMDRIWIDWYPVRAGSREHRAFRGGRYADRMKSFGTTADRLGLPLTVVVQGYGEGVDGKPQFGRRLPTPSETRYMFWASFLSRPEEILYWTLYRTRSVWLEESLLPEVRAFRERFPDAVEYVPDPGFRIRGGKADSILLGNGRGDFWLVVLDQEGRDHKIILQAPAGYAFAGGPGIAARETGFHLGPYGVQLLEISEIP